VVETASGFTLTPSMLKIDDVTTFCDDVKVKDGGAVAVINDVSFDGLSFKDFFATIRRLVLNNGNNIMEMIDEELHLKKPNSHVDPVSDVETNHPLDDVAHVIEQFEHENKGNVNIPSMTTDDPWLNKLVGNGTFIRQTDNPNPNLQGRFLLEVEDPDDEQCKPLLGMRFESPQQLNMLTRSKKSKAVKVPNQVRIFHRNRGRSVRIFNQKMKNFKFDEHGTRSTPDKAFDVE
ncbi:hypothetical protein Tco_1012946, partial [Tanacetum coccineum]